MKGWTSIDIQQGLTTRNLILILNVPRISDGRQKNRACDDEDNSDEREKVHFVLESFF